MSRPLCSVVLSTYQRAHLLARSLECYARQDFDLKEFELVVIDDHSTDNTRQVVERFVVDTGCKSVYLVPYPKEAGSWRDCGAVLNYGIRAASGHHILLTHPEVMPGRTSVADCVKGLEEFDWQWKKFNPLRNDTSPPLGLYACCRTYYLSPREQVLLNSVDWDTEGPLAVRHIDRFYEDDTNGNPDYSHRATDIVAQPGSRLPVWESFIFGGHSRETWKRLGGMIQTIEWGSVDIGWCARRRSLGIPNHTCPSESSICVHQNHNLPGEVPTDRDMEKWVRELRNFPLESPSKMRYPEIDNLGW